MDDAYLNGKINITQTKSTRDLCKKVASDGTRIGLAWSYTVDKYCDEKYMAQLGLKQSVFIEKSSINIIFMILCFAMLSKLHLSTIL